MSYVQYDRFANNPKPKGANVENKKSRVRVDFKGKMLRTQLEENLWGRSSLQILIDKSPVVYEEFIAFGGRRIDLLHDFKKGRVEYSDS
jgi:hypothetical protein